MKRWYKILIVCAASLVLLLCSVVGVSAESVDNSTYRVNIFSYFRVNGTQKGFGQITVFDGESVSGTDSVQHNGVSTFESFLYGQQLSFVDASGVPMFRAGKRYTFTADNFVYSWGVSQSDGNKGYYGTDSGKISQVRLVYIDGTTETISSSSSFLVNSKQGTYSVTAKFTPQKDVNGIIFVIHASENPFNEFDILYDQPFIVSSSYGIPSDKSLNLEISVQSEEAGLLEEINNSVQEGTDQITNGWEPNPEKPAGSDNVGELGSIEEQLQSGSEEGINAGMDMITGLGSSLAGFQKGFIFLIDLFDELTGGIPWISSVLTIGLALGIVAFLLNIVGSVASKISRDERRAEADKRRAEADARREKRQYSR